MAFLRLQAHLHPTDDTHHVTNLELFFDLVFVFAITQITHLIQHDPTAVQFARGAVLLAMIWFAWTAYSWLGNQVRADEGLMRACMLTAVGALLYAAISIPSSFNADRTGAVLFISAYIGVRLTHFAVYWVAAGQDTELRSQLLRGFTGSAVAIPIWFAGAALDEHLRLWLWLAGSTIDLVGVYATSRNPGWRLNAASHFAERFALIVMIAIGESLISIGATVSGKATITGRLVLGTLFGVLICIALWWLYFDVVVHVAEQTLLRSSGVARVNLARDSFTYLHLPVVTGIVLTALGLTFTLQEQHVHGVGVWSLFGGMAVYLFALSAIRRRNIGRWNRERLAIAVALLAIAPVAGRLDAIAQLAILATIVTALIVFEAVVFADVRDRVRHEAAEGH